MKVLHSPPFSFPFGGDLEGLDFFLCFRIGSGNVWMLNGALERGAIGPK